MSPVLADAFAAALFALVPLAAVLALRWGEPALLAQAAAAAMLTEALAPALLAAAPLPSVLTHHSVFV